MLVEPNHSIFSICHSKGIWEWESGLSMTARYTCTYIHFVFGDMVSLFMTT